MGEKKEPTSYSDHRSTHFGELFTADAEVEIYTTGDLPFVGKIVQLMTHGEVILREVKGSNYRYHRIATGAISSYSWQEPMPPDPSKEPEQT